MDGNLYCLDLYMAKVESWERCYEIAELSYEKDPIQAQTRLEDMGFDLSDSPSGDVIYKYAEVLYNE